MVLQTAPKTETSSGQTESEKCSENKTPRDLDYIPAWRFSKLVAISPHTGIYIHNQIMTTSIINMNLNSNTLYFIANKNTSLMIDELDTEKLITIDNGTVTGQRFPMPS